MRSLLLNLFIIIITIQLTISFKKYHEVYYDYITSSYYLIFNNQFYCQIANKLTYELLGYNSSVIHDIYDVKSSDLIESSTLACPIHLDQFHRYNCSSYKNYMIYKSNIINHNLSIILSTNYFDHYFNPSILPYNNQFLVSQRHEPKLMLYNKDLSNYVPLNYQSNQLMTNKEVDIRLLLLPNNKILLVFTNEQFMLNKYSVYIAIRILSNDNNNYILSNPLRLYFDKITNQEKNWSPFIYNNEIHFIRQIIPLQIFKLTDQKSFTSYYLNHPIESINVTQVSHERCKYKIFPDILTGVYGSSWEYGEIRGGTPALLINNYGYLSFFHSNKAYLYCHHYYYFGAYFFSSNKPFQLLKISSTPIVNDELIYDARYGTRMISIVFPMSFYIEDSNGNILSDGAISEPHTVVLTVGYNDTDTKIVRLSFENLIESMVDVCCI